MAKRHTIYVLLDKDGLFVDAFLSFSEAILHKQSDQRIVRIVSVYDREDY